MLVLKCGGCADIACAYWPTALGRKPSSAGEVSSNPWPHQKTMHLDLSRLVGLSLLLRQNKTFEPAERASKALRAPHRAGLFAMGS